MKKLLAKLGIAVAGLTAGSIIGLTALVASADVPIPTDGVYVQQVRVAGEVRGDWTTVACRIHVFTEPEGAGATLWAIDGQVRPVNSYAAKVERVVIDGAIAGGRATFTVDPGVTLWTRNASPNVSASCPAS